MLLYIVLDIDECSSSSLCRNGATCTNTIGGYKCSCASGFEGEHCDQGKAYQ